MMYRRDLFAWRHFQSSKEARRREYKAFHWHDKTVNVIYWRHIRQTLIRPAEQVSIQLDPGSASKEMLASDGRGSVPLFNIC